jgi:membrane protein DedA with SNARE-associated domain
MILSLAYRTPGGVATGAEAQHRAHAKNAREGDMNWIQSASYLGVLAALLAAGFGIPIPEDIPLLTAGYLCHLGRAHLFLMLPLTMFGVLSCDIILFGAGRRFGDHVLEHRWTRGLFRRATLDTVKARFHRHGAKIIFAARFMPGARAMVFVSAGIVGIPWWKFFVVDGSAALISVPTLVFLGWYGGEKSEALLAQVRHAEYWIAGAIVVATVLAITIETIWGRRRRERNAARAPAVPPAKNDRPPPSEELRAVGHPPDGEPAPPKVPTR